MTVVLNNTSIGLTSWSGGVNQWFGTICTLSNGGSIAGAGRDDLDPMTLLSNLTSGASAAARA